MIEDKELRDLFRMECEEHLQCIDDGLLNLEQRPGDPALIEAVFRAAHSVKGAARMLNLNEIQSLAHALEDAFSAIRKGDAPVNPQTVADLYQKLTMIRRLVQEAIGETTPEEALILPTPRNRQEPEIPTPETAAAASPSPDPSPLLPPSPAPVKAPPLSKPVANETAPFRIGTLRVDPQRLDALLTHTGELAITNAHIARRLPELDDIINTAEEWQHAMKAQSASGSRDKNFTLQKLAQLQTALSQLRAGLYEDSRRLGSVSEKLSDGIRTIRLLPFSTLFSQFPRFVHDLAQALHKETELVLEGGEVTADKRVLEELKDPVMHLLRNALHHGLEEPEARIEAGKSRCGKILLRASRSGNHIVLEIRDDGRGLDPAEIRRAALKQGLYSQEQLAQMTDLQIQAIIMTPGFTTSRSVTEISGRGVGLDVVRANIEKLKGCVQIHSSPGRGVAFRLQLPLTLATMRVLIVGVCGRSYALPLEYVRFSRRVKIDEFFTMEGRQTVSLDGQPVPVANLGALLELPQREEPAIPETVYCTFLTVKNECFGLIVDDLLDEMEVMLKPQSKLLKRVRNVSAATILASGEVCPVLNPSDLLQSLCTRGSHRLGPAPRTEPPAARPRKTLLLVEDSMTTRTQEKRILEGAGYEVVTAVDGLDAYHKFQSRPFDGIVSDVEMPNMNGLALTEAIRKDKKYADIPIVLVTSMSSEADQRRGLEAGANAYLVKSAFDQKLLLDCLARLV
jgi:two-component system chemotaxis sensor kinase CheA